MYQIIQFTEGKYQGEYAIRHKSIFTKIFNLKTLYVDLKTPRHRWNLSDRWFKDCITNNYSEVELIFNQLLNKRKNKIKTELKVKIIKYGK